MSALTSMRINKGGAKFAPNVKARPAVKKPAVAAPPLRTATTTTVSSEAPPTLNLPQTTNREDRTPDGLSCTPVSSHAEVGLLLTPAIQEGHVAVASTSGSVFDDQFTLETAEVSSQAVITQVFNVDIPTQSSSTRANLGNVISTPIAVPTSSASTSGTAIQIPLSNATAGPSNKRRRRSCSVLSSTESVVSGNGDEAATKKRKKGKAPAAASVELLPTYEDYNESLTRDNSEISMAQFCKLRDYQGGKPSRTWYDNQKKRLEGNGSNEGDENQPENGAKKSTPIPNATVQQTNAPVGHTAVQLRLDKNGNMIIDEESLVVDHAALYDDGQPSEVMELVDESSTNRYVNGSTYSKKEKGERWTKEQTLQFYDSISKWGTDFEIISHLFPGRSRKSIKNKFKREEKLHPDRMKEAMESKTPTSIDEYAKETGREYPIIVPKTAEEIAAEREQERLLAEAAEAARIERQKELASRAEGGSGSGRGRKKGKHNANATAGGGEEEIVGFMDNVPAAQRTFTD